MLLDTLMVKITGDASGLSSATAEAKSDISGLESSTESSAESISSMVVAKGQVIGNIISSVASSAANVVTSVTKTVVGGAVEQYSSYEQNVGGIQKLFGNMGQTLEEYAAANNTTTDAVASEWQSLEDAQDLVVRNAANAFETAGVSANTYMETVTSFSAALINSLGGDTQAAAKQAQVAMVAMSDNVNTFGTDMQDVQNAYQGFAKQNYTMLDNLKLGYGGTKEEMERLISDANEYAAANGEAADLTIDSFSDIVTAIELIQEKQNIAGTTAREASTTIEGSVNQMKAAWENWLTVLGTGDYDRIMETSVDLVESVKTALGNILPVVETVFQSISEAMPELMAELEPLLSQIVEEWGPPLATAAANALSTIFGVLTANMPDLLTILGTLLNSLIDELILNPLIGLGTTIWGNLSSWWDGVSAGIGEWVTDAGNQASEMGSEFLNNVGEFFSQLPGNVANWLQSVINNVVQFASSLLSNAQTAGKNFLSGIKSGFESAVSFVASIPNRILSALGNVGSLLWNAGSSIINGLLNGIKSAIGGVYDFVSGIAGTIASLKGPIPYDLKLLIPNGKAIMQSLLTGITNGASNVFEYVSELGSDIADSLSQDYTVQVTPEIQTGQFGTYGLAGTNGTQLQTPAATSTTNIYINGAKVNDDDDMRSVTRDFLLELKRKANL